jgi:hypothetical protein
MKRVKLEYGSEITIADEDFEQISAMVKAKKSEHFTLLYWGFPLPQTWQDGDETKQVNHWHWSFYGDPKAYQVVVIHDTIDYGSKPATGNPGKICWRITLWYRVIGGIATELAIAYSLHTASRLCRSRKPIGAGTITLVAAGVATPFENNL